jgi:CubicO group peptidase (beta-lactamase class C family)
MRRGSLRAGIALVLLVYGASTHAGRPAAQEPTRDDQTPQTLEEFRAAAAAILDEAGVPGAGIALVRADGIEWAGGIGFADLARKVPATADTHFRAGSISKTFVAMALVQLSEEGLLTLDDLLSDVLPDIAVENPWQVTHPVRIVHLLQHTAGFDDMHFAEMYNRADAPDIPLATVLRRTPGSRRVRWPPGTRMSYSNPGYAIAGLVIEKIADQPYEDYIRTHIFEPLGMTTSSFVLRPQDEQTMAVGYAGPQLRATGFPQIYLRPAGNLHTSARELAIFVQMLLNWGELGDAFIVDPEYLSNMERPRTTVASSAGLRNGYGSGIMTWVDLPYPMLGHGGGIAGFASAYGYSPARDAGFVVLLNREDARGALQRLTALATRYLKRDTAPPAAPAAEVLLDALRVHEGYYHEANPRNQALAFIQWLRGGFSISAVDNGLEVNRVFGPSSKLLAVSDTLFRDASQTAATRVFARAPDGTPIVSATVTGGEIYAQRVPRWRVEIIRWPVVASAVLLLTPLAVLVVWLARVRRAHPAGFWPLKTLLVATPLVLVWPAVALGAQPMSSWGVRSTATISVFLGTLALPTLAIVTLFFANGARARGASRWLVAYAIAVAIAGIILTVYLGSFGLIGIRLWTY